MFATVISCKSFTILAHFALRKSFNTIWLSVRIYSRLGLFKNGKTFRLALQPAPLGKERKIRRILLAEDKEK